MHNICILNKFPQTLLNDCVNYYKEVDKSTINIPLTPYHTAISASPAFLEQVNKFLPVALDNLELYSIAPNSLPVPHIDRGRKVALQIPLELDTNNTFTFAAKFENIKLLTPIDRQYHTIVDDAKIVNRPDYSFYEWDSELYDTYNLELPILQHVEQPHGGTNRSTTVRVFLSGSYKRYEYNYIKDAFKEFC